MISCRLLRKSRQAKRGGCHPGHRPGTFVYSLDPQHHYFRLACFAKKSCL